MGNYSHIIESIGGKPRKEQEKLCNAISKAALDKNCLFAQADTGIGKTLAVAISVSNILEIPSKKNRKVIIATSTLALCNDLHAALLSVDVECEILMSYRNFFSTERIELAIHENPKLASELTNMLNWAGTIDQYVSEYSSLPGNLRISQVCQTESTKSDKYKFNREVAISSNVIITTHAMIACDMMQSGRLLNLSESETSLVVDEADAFIDFLKDFNVRHFNIMREFSYIKKLCTSKFSDSLDNILNSTKVLAQKTETFSAESKKVAENVLNTLQSDLKSYKKRNLTFDEKSTFSEYASYFDWMITDIKRSSNISIGLTEENSEPSIALYSPYFSRVFGGYALENISSIILMSGTLSIDSDIYTGTEWVSRDLKLEHQEIVRETFSPSQFGNIGINFNISNMSMYKPNSDGVLSIDWLENTAKYIDKLNGKILIITTSFDETKRLSKLLSGEVLEHTKGKRLSVIKDQFTSSVTRCVLIRPSAHTGINFTNDEGRSVITHIVATRLGFSVTNPILKMISGTPNFPESKILNLKRSEYFSNLNKVIRRLKQICGRGIRHENDFYNLHFMDERFPFFKDLTGKYAALRNSIPARFSEEYRTAKITNSLSIPERKSLNITSLY